MSEALRAFTRRVLEAGVARLLDPGRLPPLLPELPQEVGPPQHPRVAGEL